MTDLPTGTVAFLFTDIEGSTKLWEHHPDEMKAALARHDALLREAIESNRGYVFKTVGDAFCAAFPSALDGLNAAIAAQRALNVGAGLAPAHEGQPQGLPRQIRVRMGLHTGNAEERDGDYFGPPLNRVARLMSAGHGGQILLTQASFELVRDSLPEAVTLRDMGERRLKDLLHPERVYQILVPDLPSDFPPLKTLDARPNNLSAQSNPFIGREKEITEIKKLLARTRLLTLMGVGGMGKTRLALQVAADIVDDFEHGVFFVPLATIKDSALVLQTIAQTFDVREATGRQLIGQLKDYLREKELLLALDNFEQVIDAAPMLTDLLSVAPRLKILVTSRELLRLSSEIGYSVPPLCLPDPKRLPPVQHLTQYEAVALFIERAQAVKSDFNVTNENAPAVAEICYQLDGLPLAIELAAARVRVLPPQKILSQLSNRLRFLTGGARDLPARQQTLRNAIDWSYKLLVTQEQILFRRLSVFVGGCTLEAAESICNANGILDVLNGIESLVDKSLLKQISINDEPRFMMLETIREYAREKLVESDETEVVPSRHLDFFLKFAEEAEPELIRQNQAEWFNRLELEHGNLNAALSCALERHVVESALRLGVALWRFWDVHGNWTEGRQWLLQLLDAGESMIQSQSHDVRVLSGKAQIGASRLASLQGDHATSRMLCEKSLSLFRELGDQQSMATSLNNLGNVASDQGDYATARDRYAESLTLYRELGDKRGMSTSFNNLGIVAFFQGDYAAARALYEESLALHRESGNKNGIASTLYNLGEVALRQGDYARARTIYSESLTLMRELGYRQGIAACLFGWAELDLVENQPQRATKLSGAAAALLEAIGAQVALDQQRTIAAAHNQMDEIMFNLAWNEGRAMSLEQAIEYALEVNDDSDKIQINGPL